MGKDPKTLCALCVLSVFALQPLRLGSLCVLVFALTPLPAVEREPRAGRVKHYGSGTQQRPSPALRERGWG